MKATIGRLLQHWQAMSMTSRERRTSALVRRVNKPQNRATEVLLLVYETYRNEDILFQDIDEVIRSLMLGGSLVMSLPLVRFAEFGCDA